MWSYSFYARGANKNGKDTGGYFLLCCFPPRLWRSDYIKQQTKTVSRGWGGGVHVARTCLRGPAVVWEDLHSEWHIKDEERTQTNRSQMTRWMRQGAVREKVRSDTTLNTPPVFTGRRRECEECLPSEPMPRAMALIKRCLVLPLKPSSWTDKCWEPPTPIWKKRK